MIYAVRNLDLEADLRFLSKPNKWMTIKDSHARVAITELLSLASTALIQAYNKVRNLPDFKHRNWFRSTETLADIRSELGVIPKYRKVVDLPLIRDHKDR